MNKKLGHYTETIYRLDQDIKATMASLQHCDGPARTQRKRRIAQDIDRLNNLVKNQQLVLDL